MHQLTGDSHQAPTNWRLHTNQLTGCPETQNHSYLVQGNTKRKEAGTRWDFRTLNYVQVEWKKIGEVGEKTKQELNYSGGSEPSCKIMERNLREKVDDESDAILNNLLRFNFIC